MDKFLEYAGPISDIILAVVAVVVTVGLYSFQKRKEKKEKTIDFSKRHEDRDFYIQVLSPVWKISLKWKYLPFEHREKYQRVVAMGWVGFESQEPEEILSNWIPDFKLTEDYVKEHYLEKLNIDSQTEHEALTMYIHFWTEFWVALKQDLIDEKICINIAQQYQYHKDFFFELRKHIKHLQKTEFQNDKLPVWIGQFENLEKFFMRVLR